jgi:hypothetical protein
MTPITYLSYCGCKQHWHPGGIPTGLDTERLLKVATINRTGSGPRAQQKNRRGQAASRDMSTVHFMS